MLASCSEDGSVCVFEEQESALSAQDNGSTSKWVKKIELSNRNSKKAVNDVEFANRSLGIKLATASADGYIRIYEARDVFNLNEWELMVSETFPSLPSPSKQPIHPLFFYIPLAGASSRRYTRRKIHK